jgi:chromosome segregation ATPase
MTIEDFREKSARMNDEIETLRRQLAEAKESLGEYICSEEPVADATKRLVAAYRDNNASVNKLCKQLNEQEDEFAAKLAEKDSEIERLNKNLLWSMQCTAESEAREAKLREALENHSGNYKLTKAECAEINAVIQQAESQNDTALREYVAKAGEVMRQRCADRSIYMEREYPITGQLYESNVSVAIRALPGVTLEDLK